VTTSIREKGLEVMRKADEWFREYGDSHRNPANKLLHWICVPSIVLNVIGVLWGLPFPDVAASRLPWVNWATLAMLAGMSSRNAGHRSSRTCSSC
jgi:uncharacterized membrane protein YGL010W